MLYVFRISALATVLLATLATATTAQPWPSRPIKIILPFGGGGPGESVMRPLVESLQKELGQPVIVEHRPGAGGTTGAAAVARSDPDGYTLLYGTNSPLAVGPIVYAKAGYTSASFVPISLIYQTPFVVSVSRKSGIETMAQLVEAVRITPEKYSFASVGLATTTHLLAELINIRANIKMAHVPYRGPSFAMADLVSGQIQMFIDGISNKAPQHDSGSIRSIMVLAPERAPTLPQVPTSKEAGFPEIVAHLWAGLAAPAGTPREIIQRLNREVDAAILRPELKAQVAKLGIEIVGGPPEHFADRIAREMAVWREVAEQAKVRIE